MVVHATKPYSGETVKLMKPLIYFMYSFDSIKIRINLLCCCVDSSNTSVENTVYSTDHLKHADALQSLSKLEQIVL
jgi:hypothetical protein